MKTVLIIIAIFGSIIISHAQFNFYFYSASLDGSQEIPPNSSPGIGDADFTLSNTTFSVTSGSYSDLQGNASGITVNISPPPGTNSPVIFSLTLNSPGTTSGTFTGFTTLTSSLITDLNNGNLYVNIQSSVYPGGEIRGQIVAVPEPATMAFIGIGLLALLALRRRKL